jgi:hypothetical protein
MIKALDLIPSNAAPEQAYDGVVVVINRIKAAIARNPGVNINDLKF